MDRGADRTPTLPADLGRAVCGRLGAVRARPGHWPDGGVPRDPGRGGRGDDAVVTGDSARELPGRKGHAFNKDLLGPKDGRACDLSISWGLDNPDLVRE